MDDTPYKPVDLPEQMLKDAESISLRELLESPSAQAWIVSALANCARHAHNFEGHDSHMDEYLQFRARKLVNQINHDDKMYLFTTTSDLIKQSKRADLSR
jgi:hypothetical protein